MSSLNDSANRVLSEFGGRIPPNLLQFEDARREFLQVRSLEMQKLGIADTDKTVTSKMLNPNTRIGSLTSYGDMTPAFVEFQYNASPTFEKVEIVPVEKIPEYEGGFAIAFFDNKYRVSWDFWNTGSVVIWYDPIEDLMDIKGGDDVSFAPAFVTYLVKQAAFNLTGVIMLNFAFNGAVEDDERMKMIVGALQSFQNGLIPQIQRWEKEFRKFVNAPLNTQNHLRGSNAAIVARGYGNVRGGGILDDVG